MANTLANLARMYTETTGTGTLTLTTAVPGFNTFEDAGVTTGATITYAIYCGPHREIGTGVYTEAGLTLTRATVYSSTNAGAKINLTGRSEVFITAAKEDFDTFLTTAAAAAAYQPLDADLTTLAANITAFGHSLVDDADNTAARTTLGLGTAAVKNTGTSGDAVPLLNTANTFSAAQAVSSSGGNEFTVDSTTAGTNTVLVRLTEDSATAGPYVTTVRISASPAASDQIGVFNFRARNSAAAAVNYGQIIGEIVDPTSGSEDGRFGFQTLVAGASAYRMTVGQGAFMGSATGGDQGVGTFNAVTLYENGTSLAAKYQGLDSELTAIAGLTSAADRLPYFTGSGTAALATFTTAGRNLVDDADASAQRTTLGLGTAAVKNTGTSGDAVPLLDQQNTFSASQICTVSASFGLPMQFISTNADNFGGPFLYLYRNSSSPAANDVLSNISMRGQDSGGNAEELGSIKLVYIDPTNGSETAELQFITKSAGANPVRIYVRTGVVIGAPTGGDKGAGTLNAVGVYDDSVLLCAPVEYMKSGTVNTATWDAFATDIVEPERVEEIEEYIEIDELENHLKPSEDGSYTVVHTVKKVPVMETVPVYDKDGNGIDAISERKITRRTIPARTIKRRNELAHEFKAMLDEGFDPRDPKAYFDKMLADEALPGLKTKANWVPNEESNAKRTNRIILALELQTAAFKTVYEQVEALKAEVAALKARRI